MPGRVCTSSMFARVLPHIDVAYFCLDYVGLAASCSFVSGLGSPSMLHIHSHIFPFQADFRSLYTSISHIGFETDQTRICQDYVCASGQSHTCAHATAVQQRDGVSYMCSWASHNVCQELNAHRGRVVGPFHFYCCSNACASCVCKAGRAHASTPSHASHVEQGFVTHWGPIHLLKA